MIEATLLARLKRRKGSFFEFLLQVADHAEYTGKLLFVEMFVGNAFMHSAPVTILSGM